MGRKSHVSATPLLNQRVVYVGPSNCSVNPEYGLLVRAREKYAFVQFDGHAGSRRERLENIEFLSVWGLSGTVKYESSADVFIFSAPNGRDYTLAMMPDYIFCEELGERFCALQIAIDRICTIETIASI